MMARMDLSRRHFLEAAFASLAPLQAADGMPTRLLGSTGARVSAIAFGCGSRFLAYKEEDKAIAAIHRAMDHGISYFDSAYDYGKGQSETWVGKALADGGRRKKVFLVTKTPDRTYDGTMRLMEGSLRRFQTDQIDLIHAHALNEEDDLAKLEAPEGALKALYKLRDEKVTRFIGVTCHNNPMVLRTALERHDFNSTQMALNAARVGMAVGKPSSFETLALPVALQKKMGVTAMKIFGQEKLLGQTSIDNLIRYSMSLPVAACVLGMPKIENLDQNVAIAKGFKPMPREEMESLGREMAGKNKLALDRFFADHIDA
jgi:predicted aldo/keto reductase-like oxidoreductase